MKLYHIITGPLRVNTYILENEQTHSAVVIDCGENYKILKNAQEQYGFKIKAVLLTHAHFDHSGCVKKLQQEGVRVYISSIDAPKLNTEDTLACHFGRQFESLTPDQTFEDGETLTVEGLTFKALITAGHTDGSACFIVDDMIFSGDTLFRESVGRTDFPTGSRWDIVESVKRLFDLEGDYQVYPGHEEFTTLDYERKHNVFADYD